MTIFGSSAFRVSALLAAVALVTASCGGPAAPAATTSPSPSPKAAKATLFVLSNSSPHVSVIDGETNQVVRKADLPNFTSWTWNDDNNYFDGKNLWLGTKNPDTTDVEIIALNLGTLEVAARVPIGKDKQTVYISKAARNGILHIGKMASGQIVAIDTKAARVVNTWDVPVNGGVVCDIDVHVGPDGVERVYYPTWKGDTVVIVNPQTGEVLKTTSAPKGAGPWMNTLAPDGRLWVQEGDANTNAVLDPVNLTLIKRFPTGKSPTNVSFSPDGRYGYITYLADTVVTVVDAKSLDTVQNVQVGTNPHQVGVHPNGRVIYAILTKEASLAVIDTASWSVSGRIPLGTNPSGIFVQTLP